MATDGITQTLDLLARDPEVRNDFDIIVSNDTSAKDILNVLTPIEKIPAFKMLNSLKASEEFWGTTSLVNIDDLVKAIQDKRGFVLFTIEIQGDKELGIDRTNIQCFQT